MRKIIRTFALIPLAITIIAGCGGEGDAPLTKEEAPKKPFDPMALELSDANLIEGRRVWMETCTGCHSNGLGGAPIIADKEAWSKRIAKGDKTLHEHAINGFSGPLMLVMPPKGGYDYLSDEEVMSAVDFMIYASR